MRKALLLLGIISCVIAVHPSCGRAETSDERRAKPLALRSIEFFNTTYGGSAISRATNSFDAATVVFVGWQVKFDNRLHRTESHQYRVDAVYIGPDGRMLGSVNDFQSVSPSMKAVTFSGRIGNSRGGAFLPGTYTVDFYLDGEPFAKNQFRVVADASGSDANYLGGGLGDSTGSPTPQESPMSGSMLGPTIVAAGTISSSSSGGTSEMEVKLRPHPDGFLTGEVNIYQSGFGLEPITGTVLGTQYTFSLVYGEETYYFQGQRDNDQIGGTFESQPTGERGTWVAQAN